MGELAEFSGNNASNALLNTEWGTKKPKMCEVGEMLMRASATSPLISVTSALCPMTSFSNFFLYQNLSLSLANLIPF